jgi:rhomboid family protein
MGLADRDYYRTPPPGQVNFRAVPRGWSFTTWLIIINVAVFVIDGLLAARGIGVRVRIRNMIVALPPLEAWGHFSAATAIKGLQLWRFITFQFLHAGVTHLLFNMLALYFFGQVIEAYLGSRRFLAFYLLCGVAGGVSYLILWGAGVLVSDATTPLVGASAGIFGVLVGAARVAPRARVMLLFPPIPMELRTLAWALVGIGVFVVMTGGHNAGGEAAHLGGAVVGFFLIRRPTLLNFAEFRRQPRPPQRVFFEPMAPHDRSDPDQDAELDRILAKVKDHGLQSLTDREKDYLQRATDRKRQAG